MGMFQRARGPADEVRIQSGYHGWRTRWSVWQRRSMIAAAGVHGLLFVAWPVWELSYQPPLQPLEMVQITPVASPGTASAPAGAPTAADAPTEAEVEEVSEAEPEGITISSDEELLALMGLVEVLDGVRPTVVYPLLVADDAEDEDDPDAGDLVLKMQDVEARLTGAPGVDVWPLIRNPTAVVHYLRRTYNPMYREPGPTGLVSVALFVNEVGAVEWAAVRESSGYTALDEIALAMVNDVVLFRPVRGSHGRVPVTVVMQIPFQSPW